MDTTSVIWPSEQASLAIAVTLGDLAHAYRQPVSESPVARALTAGLTILSGRQRKVFGGLWLNDRCMTRRDLARRLDLSPQKLQRLETSALAILKRVFHTHGIELTA